LKHIERPLTRQGPKLIFGFRQMLFLIDFKHTVIFISRFLKKIKKGG